MALPEVVTRDEWLMARKALLVKEKEATRARDAVNAERRRLPMVEIDKPYRFQGPAGEVGLLELFDGRRQLIVEHVMFDPVPRQHVQPRLPRHHRLGGHAARVQLPLGRRARVRRDPAQR